MNKIYIQVTVKHKTAKPKMTQAPMEVLVSKTYLSLEVNQSQKIVTLIYPDEKR